MSDGRGEGISWFKIVAFGLVVLMLAGIASVLLDSGLGTPHESRRIRHPAGFSIVYPRGWGGSIVYAQGAVADGIRLGPERVTGRQSAINVTRSTRDPKLPDAAKKVTFQGKEAWATATQLKRDATYRLDFQRDGAWYSLLLSSPIALEWERDPMMAYAETFRTERVLRPETISLPADPPAAEVAPTTAPTTAATQP